MERYTTIAGEIIEYDATPAEAAFLARVFDAANAPRVSEAELIDLVYGKENPVLRQDLLPHHGVVTQEVFDRAVYRVMVDLLGRKRVQLGRLDLGKARAEYTMTVAEAAEKLGVHQSAIRTAIRAGKLDAVKQGGVHLLRPSSVDAYHVSRRGPRPRAERATAPPVLDLACGSGKCSSHILQVVLGSVPGRSFRVQVAGGGLAVERKEGAKVFGRVQACRRVAVLANDKAKGRMRFYELEPADEEAELTFEPFFVRGRFRLACRENNARRAGEAWRRFGRERAGEERAGE